jgi:hypothetical protein
MSGSINIASLFASSSDSTTSSLLTTIYGTSSAPSGANVLQALTTAEKNQTQDIAVTAKEPQVQRDVAGFQAAIAKATSVTDLLKNPTFMKVLLTANGLGDQTAYTALAQKALTSDPSVSTSLVNQLSDTRWKTVAQTYDFATKGLAIIQDPKVQATIANGYAEVTWRTSLDATTPGLSNAMTFKAEASTVMSALQILGDSTLRTVVTTALGIPPQIAYQSIEAQEKAINDRVDVTRFQDPNFVNSFTQKYLLAAQTSSTSSSPTLDALAIQATGLLV